MCANYIILCAPCKKKKTLKSNSLSHILYSYILYYIESFSEIFLSIFLPDVFLCPARMFSIINKKTNNYNNKKASRFKRKLTPAGGQSSTSTWFITAVVTDFLPTDG